MSGTAHLMKGDGWASLAVVLEAGGGTDAAKQARAATDYASGTATTFIFRKVGSSTVYEYTTGVTLTIVAATTATAKIVWVGTEAPCVDTAGGYWDFWVRVTVSSKTAQFPNDGSAFRLYVTPRVST